MNGIASARELLPFWVVWGQLLWLPPLAFLVALALTWLESLINLAPLRQSRDLPWTERARLAYPARRAILVASLVWPIGFALVAYFLHAPLCPVPLVGMFLLVYFAATFGVAWVGYRVERTIRQGKFTPGDFLRAWVLNRLMLTGWIPLVLALLVAMPHTFDWRTWVLLGCGSAALLWFSMGGGFTVARMLGLAPLADERVQNIVADVAEQSNIRVRGVHAIHYPIYNAFALPFLGRIGFTTGALDLFDDAQLRAITAHELAHLSEPVLVKVGRLLPMLFLAALTVAVPTVLTWGALAFLGILAGLFLAFFLVTILSRQMERRADRAAATQVEQGVYASALARLYEANLAPVVEPGRGTSHPHLYDRLVAAGVPPTYPRPKPPPRLRATLATLPGLVLLALLVVALLLLNATYNAPLFPRASAHLDERLQSEPLLLRSLAVGGNQSWLLQHLCANRMSQGNPGEAVVFLHAAEEIDVDSPELPARRCILLAYLGRHAEAVAAIREARSRQDRQPTPAGKAAIEAAKKVFVETLRRQPKQAQ